MRSIKQFNEPCPRCGAALAKMRGRVFKKAVEQTGTEGKYPRIPSNKWVVVCPLCDAYALGTETFTPWPFICGDGVVRTALDFDPNGSEIAASEHDYFGLRLSTSAFNRVLALTNEHGEPGKVSVETRSVLKEIGLDITPPNENSAES